MVEVLPAGVFLAVDQHRLSRVTDGNLEFKGLGVAAVHPGTDCLLAAAKGELSGDRRQTPLLLGNCSSSTFKMASTVRMVEQGLC